ncbi:TonB-dependent siderophore receptor [Phenylobacterium sp.]|uniref:TonB-dependent receptor n=1 Tax=Phenylobacterium sp. TaxID=1871053 RepID=UPI0027268472|nr:TonB-dependent receptor [Phenylobacterium sp.]MDO8378427.1 TonB-dependent receptor [Phenylobacterium sp.]
MQRVRNGVSARAKRALTCAAVAGAAGLSLGGVAQAADDGAMAAADDGGATVSTLDVQGRRKALDNVKLTAEPLNHPQTVTVVPRGVIEAQNLLSLRDILSTVPGITFGAGEGGGGFGDSINLRGYSANNDLTIDGVRDSAQYSRSDPFNLEQIEVTNGANSVYSGAGSVGGTINIVSKRPNARDSSTVTGALGLDSYYRATLDTNHKVSDSVAVRLNLMVHRNDAPGRDVESFERWGIAPSIVIGLDGPTQFTALYVHQEDKNTPQYGVPFYNGRPLPGVDPSTYYGYSNIDTQEQTVDILTGIIDHDFGDGLTLRNLTRAQKVTQLTIVDPPQGTWCLANGQKPAAWSQSTTATNLTGFTACLASDPAPGLYQPSGPRGTYRDSENTLLYNQTDFSWRGEIAGLEHDAVLGVALLSETFELTNGNVLRNANGTAVALPPMSIANPNTTYAGAYAFIQGGGAAPSGTPLTFPAGAQDGERANQAVYLFDNITLSDRWSVNFGVRWEHNAGENISAYYTSAGYLPNPSGGTAPGPALAGAPGGVFSGQGPLFKSDETLFTYRLGVVFKPTPNSSLYVAYGNSQTPSQATVNGSGACALATCKVDPEEAENIEVGGKLDIDGRLSLTAALFRNDRTNYKVASGDPTVPDQQLDGSARVTGVALGLSGKLTEAWAIFANYTWLDTEVLQGVSRFAARAGLDFTKGDPLTSVPDHAFSLFTTYDLPRDVQVGYGVTYQGEYFLTQHGQITGSVPPARTTIPLVTSEAYWVHRATIAWTPRPGLELRLNVNNLLDEVYYVRGRNNGWSTPGDRRTATASVSYRF